MLRLRKQLIIRILFISPQKILHDNMYSKYNYDKFVTNLISNLDEMLIILTFLMFILSGVDDRYLCYK